MSTAKSFFEISDTANEERRRLLLLSYHFPPAQAAGALRWQKLARHGHELGWTLDVLTLDPGSLQGSDPAGLKDLPPGIRVFGLPVVDPTLVRLERALLRLRRAATATRNLSGVEERRGERNAAGLDSYSRDELTWRPRSTRDLARVFFSGVDYARHGGWARLVADTAIQLAGETDYLAVITCGPPHMVHEGGRIVSRRLGIPLIMDMRDPWSLWQRLPEHLASPVWLAMARRYERRCVRDAALVAVNTDPLRIAMQKEYPGAASRIVTVMNGFDEEEMPPPTRSSRFVIAYAGAVYIDRDPRPLLTAAARIIRELRLGPSQVSIEFMGEAKSFQGITIDQLAVEAGVSEYVRCHPARPRKEALDFLATASVLLILPQDSELAIPSKLFEYVRYDAWIIALARQGSAVAHVLSGTGAAVVDPADTSSLAEVLRDRYVRFASGERPASVAKSQPRLSRRTQAAILFDAIEKLTRAHAPEPRAPGGPVTSSAV